VILAEDATEGYHDEGKFPNLLILEEALARLASTILVFAESPGSIGELGAFAAVDIIRDKTVAVIDRHHEVRPSFIKDGPLASLRALTGEHVYYYDLLNDEEPPHLMLAYLNDHFSDLAEALKHREASLDKTQIFDPKQPKHIMLLLSDLAHLFRAVTKTELENLCGHFGCEFTAHQIDQYLFVLRKLSLIQYFEYGGTPWYTSDRDFMEYVGSNDKSIDATRMGVRISRYLAGADSKKAKAFRSHQRTSISSRVKV